MIIATTPDLAALQAENARLRAIVDRVEALASGARLHWNAAPANNTLAVVGSSHPDSGVRTDVYLRDDQPDAPQGGDWYWQSLGASGSPITWDEMNGFDDAPCDRPSVSIETFVSVEGLIAALGGAA